MGHKKPLLLWLTFAIKYRILNILKAPLRICFPSGGMIMIFFAVIAAVFFLDLHIKNRIEKADPASFPRKRFGFTIRRLHNKGLMLNFLERRPVLARFLSLSAFLLAFSLCLPYVWKKGGLLVKLALGLFFGGALSNLYDHFYRGYVVDYIRLPIKKIRNIIFNIADFFIFIGAALSAVYGLFKK